MKKILVVSATQIEINEVQDYFLKSKKKSNHRYQLKKINLTFLVTGVGISNTAYELGKLYNKKFYLVINVGIVGSFDNHKIGSIVNVTKDCYSELGAEDADKFIPINELGFGNQHVEIENKFKNHIIIKIPKALGISVNTVHGNESTIKKIKELYNPQIETMEGAAFIESANKNKWCSLQLRAISNRVEKRNTKNWNVPLAIHKLNKKLVEIIFSLENTL